MGEQRGSNNRCNWEVAGFEPKKPVEQRDDYRKPTVGRRYSMSISSHFELSKLVVSSKLMRLNDKVKGKWSIVSYKANQKYLELFLSYWKRSMLPGICGILAGSLYRLNVFRVRRMKFPEAIASFFSRLSWPSMGSTSPSGSSRNIAGSTPRNVLGCTPPYVGRQVEGNYLNPALSSSTEPPKDSISTLVSMGFDRNSARQGIYISIDESVSLVQDIADAAHSINKDAIVLCHGGKILLQFKRIVACDGLVGL